MRADDARMGTLLIVHNGKQFKEQFDEHLTEAAHDLEGVRAAMARRRFDAVWVDGGGGGPQLGEMLAALSALDPCVSVVVGGAGWSPELRSAAEACEVLVQPGELEVVQFAVRRAMRQTAMMRENHAFKAKLETVRDEGWEGSAAGQDETQGPHVGTDLGWVDSLTARLDLRELLGLVEKTVIQKTLAATQGAQAEAARRLGLSRSDLSYKLAKYELRKPKLERVQPV